MPHTLLRDPVDGPTKPYTVVLERTVDVGGPVSWGILSTSVEMFSSFGASLALRDGTCRMHT